MSFPNLVEFVQRIDTLFFCYDVPVLIVDSRIPVIAPSLYNGLFLATGRVIPEDMMSAAEEEKQVARSELFGRVRVAAAAAGLMGLLYVAASLPYEKWFRSSNESAGASEAAPRSD